MPRLPGNESTYLKYSQVEDLLAGLLDVHQDGRSKLSSRIRLFRQWNFPPNVISLAKTRFGYDLDATLRLALAFWMINAFIPQEAASQLIEANWKELRRAFQFAYTTSSSTGQDANKRQVLLLKAQNLLHFTLRDGEKPKPSDLLVIEIVTASEAQERVFEDPCGNEFMPAIVIDLHWLALWVRKAIEATASLGEGEFDKFVADQQ